MIDYKKTEDAIIGSIISRPAIFDEVRTEIYEDYFTDNDNKQIYKSILELKKKNLEINLLSVINSTKGTITASDIADKFNNSIYDDRHVETLIIQLKENYIIKKSMDYSFRFASAVASQSFEEIIGTIEEMNNFISGVAQMSKGARSMFEIIPDCLQQLLKRKENFENQKPTGILSTIKRMDLKIGGFKGNQMIVIAARPGMGKTSFAVQLAKEAAKQDKHCLFFSLEMGDTQIGDKIILSQTSVDPDRYKNGNLYDQELQEVHSVMSELQQLKIEIDDKPNSTIQYIESQATLKKHMGLCDAIFVDYIGLIGNESKLNVREQYIADVSRRLKGLSKTLDVPVFVLCQLNREVEKRSDKMPQKSDLRESGAVEQDADIIIFIMRPSEYNLTFNDLSDYNLDKYVSDLNGITLFAIDKNREGGTGLVIARNNEAVNTFTDVNY